MVTFYELKAAMPQGQVVRLCPVERQGCLDREYGKQVWLYSAIRGLGETVQGLLAAWIDGTGIPM